MSAALVVRDRARRVGFSALRIDELLSLVANSDAAARALCESHGHDVRQIARLDVAALGNIAGMGEARAMQVAAAFELARRLPRAKAGQRPVLSTPGAVWRYVQMDLRDADRESFEGLALDARNGLLRHYVISTGSLNASIVHPREVFKPALAVSAASVVVIHNHPSGDPAPSREDREVTRVLSEAGRVLDIPLHDHVVIGADSYFSFQEAGLM